MATEQGLRRSDGLEEELRMLYGYGAGAKAIRWLAGRAKEVIWLWRGAKAIRWLGGEAKEIIWLRSMEQMLSDGLEEKLRRLYSDGAGANQIRRLWNRNQCGFGAGAKVWRQGAMELKWL